MSSVRSPVLPTPSIFLLPVPLSLSLSACPLFSLSRRFATFLLSADVISLSLSLQPAPYTFASLSIYLSIHLSLSLFFSSSAFLSQSYAAIFHLESKRSLAINPRIHYGLRGSLLLLLRDITLPARRPACVGHRLRLPSAGPPRRSRHVVFRVCDVIPGHWSDVGFHEYRRNSPERCRATFMRSSAESSDRNTDTPLQYTSIIIRINLAFHLPEYA